MTEAAGTAEPGRLQPQGHDFEQGHLEYVERTGAQGQLWLQNKPFSAPPNEELIRCLRTFSHIVERLGLGLRAQVLDVGCGPGWMSEFLARCGYWVTGIDVSPDMVEIARSRVHAIERPVGEGVEAHGEFHVMAVQEMPWSGRFDAAILYDTLHHFHDELETLSVIRRTLVPGGQLYVHEGVRPEPGSAGEAQLLAEMERWGTLESPFDPEYLDEVVLAAGFTGLRRFVEVDQLVELGGDQPEVLAQIGERMLAPETNTVLAVNPVAVADEAGAEGFAARIEASGPLQALPGGEELVTWLTLTNTGRSFWPAGTDFPFPSGIVTVAPFLRAAAGDRVELPRTRLPRSISPGESVAVEVRVRAELTAGSTELTVDLVREGLAWFEELGSEPLRLGIGSG